MHKVGSKGQVVIEKRLRDQLGVRPGWDAVQRVVDGRLEIIFLPPVNPAALAGSLAKYVTRTIVPGEERDRAKQQASEAVAREGTWDRAIEDERHLLAEHR